MDRGRGAFPRFMVAVAVILATAGLAAVALAAQGDPDPTFNGGHPLVVSSGPAGSSTALTALAKQADGKIVVAGSTDSSNGLGAGIWLIERYLPSGQLDGSFGNGGVVKLTLGSFSFASAVLVQPADQKIVVAGAVGTGVEFVRLNTNGTPDHSFGGTGEVSLSRPDLSVISAGRMARDSAGNLYLAGSGDTNPGASNVGFIAAVTSTGAAKGWGSGGIVIPDTSSAGTNPQFNGVAVVGSSVFFVGSLFGSSQQGLVGAVNSSSGSLVSTFGSHGLFTLPANTSLNSILLGSDGKLKATGFGVGTGPGTGALIASFKTSGANPTDTAFGSGGRVVVGGKPNQPNNGNALTDSGGELVAATTAVLTGNTTQVALVGVNEKTGALDKGLGPGGFRLYTFGGQSFATDIVDPPRGPHSRYEEIVAAHREKSKTASTYQGELAAVDIEPDVVLPPAKPDFRLVITRMGHQLVSEQVGKTASGKPLYEGVRVQISVTNDGRAKGAATVHFVAGHNPSFTDLARSANLQPDTTAGIRLMNQFGPIPTASMNCKGTWVIPAGDTIEATCVLVTQDQFLTPGPIKFMAEVLPLDSPSDPSRDNDTSTDNRPPAEEITVLAPPNAEIQHTPKTSDAKPEISGSGNLEVVARDGASVNPAAIKQVLLGLVRVPSGARAASTPSSCRWLSNPRGRFVKRRTRNGLCAHPVFVKATGAGHWHLTLQHKLPCGRYVVYAAAVDNAGFRETTFSAKQGNRRRFKIC